MIAYGCSRGTRTESVADGAREAFRYTRAPQKSKSASIRHSGPRFLPIWSIAIFSSVLALEQICSVHLECHTNNPIATAMSRIGLGTRALIIVGVTAKPTSMVVTVGAARGSASEDVGRKWGARISSHALSRLCVLFMEGGGGMDRSCVCERRWLGLCMHDAGGALAVTNDIHCLEAGHWAGGV